MKKRLVLGLVAFFLFSLPIVANAISIINDTTEFGFNYARDALTHENDLIGAKGSVIKLLGGAGDYVAWRHQYKFLPPIDSVISGELTLHFEDDNGWQGRDTLDLFNLYEYADLLVGNTSLLHLGEIDTGFYDPISLDGAFLEDGSLELMLTSTGGDFSILQSDLRIVYNEVVPNPEPATVLFLISGGVVGLMFRKKKEDEIV